MSSTRASGIVVLFAAWMGFVAVEPAVTWARGHEGHPASGHGQAAPRDSAGASGPDGANGMEGDSRGGMFHFGSANRPGPTISAANRPGPTFGAANRPGPMVEGAGPMGGGAGIGGTSGSVVSPFGSTFGMKPPFAFGSSGAPDPAGLRQGAAGQGDLIGPAPTGPDRRKSLPPNPLPKGIVPSSNVNRSLPVNRLPPETSKSVAAAVASRKSHHLPTQSGFRAGRSRSRTRRRRFSTSSSIIDGSTRRTVQRAVRPGQAGQN